MSLLSLLSAFLFFFMLLFILHVSCNPLCESMSWILNLWCDSSRKGGKKWSHSKPPSHILYFISTEKDRQRGTYRVFGSTFHLILWLLLPVFPKSPAWFVFPSEMWLTLAQRLGGQAVNHHCTSLGLARSELPPTPCGLVSQEHSHYVTAHYHVPSRANVGDMNSETSSRTLQSPPSAFFFWTPPSPTSTTLSFELYNTSWPLCSLKVSDASWSLPECQKSVINVLEKCLAPTESL